MSRRKQLGRFYTPADIAEFIVAYVAKGMPQKKRYEILEPSVGGGVFLNAIFNSEFARKADFIKIDAVDINEIAAKKSLLALTKAQRRRTNFTKQNFLQFQKKCSKKYDLIIGNPPYVSKKIV